MKITKSGWFICGVCTGAYLIGIGYLYNKISPTESFFLSVAFASIFLFNAYVHREKTQ